MSPSRESKSADPTATTGPRSWKLLPCPDRSAGLRSATPALGLTIAELVNDLLVRLHVHEHTYIANPFALLCNPWGRRGHGHFQGRPYFGPLWRADSG